MKKVMALLLLLISILLCIGVVSFAGEKDVLECSNISFNDSLGNPVTTLSEEQFVAEVSVKNTGTEAVNPVLVVCSYHSGKLNRIWYDSAEKMIESGNVAEISVVFTPITADENTVIKATLIDGLLTLNAPVASAEMFRSTTCLESIMVGDKRISDYSDDKDKYLFKITNNESKVSAQAADGGTKVEVIQPEQIPGNAVVNLTATDGSIRCVEVTLYSEDEQLYSLTNLNYEVDGVEYELEGFDPDITNYTVELPQNTFYTSIRAEALDIADTNVTITDPNPKDKTFGGVSYFLGNSYSHRAVERDAIDNVVPIKNEETDAHITVTTAEGQKKYTVKFVARQPRLTEFNLGEGTFEEREKPYFISGAAINNDNGTAVGADRGNWTLGGFTKPLLGGSMISLSSIDSGRSAESWQKLNTSGEWCSFRADTPGTIYVMSVDNISTTYYNSENGWTRLSNSGLKYYNSANGQSLKVNETSEAYCFSSLQWNDAAESRSESGVLNPATIKGVVNYTKVVSKTFEAGELVSIHHPGKTSSNGCAEAIIVWDLTQE